MKRIVAIVATASLIVCTSPVLADLTIQSPRYGTIGNIASSWLSFGWDESGASTGTATRWRLDGSLLVDLDESGPGSVSLADGSASVDG